MLKKILIRQAGSQSLELNLSFLHCVCAARNWREFIIVYLWTLILLYETYTCLD